MKAPSAPVRVLIKYRFKRIFNMLASGFKRKPKKDEKRKATAKKGTRSWMTAIIVVGWMFIALVMQSWTLVTKTLEAPIPNPVRLLSLESMFIFLTVFLSNLSSKELTRVEWDLEWLVTLPLPFSKLIRVRILERAMVNPSAMLFLWPFVTFLFYLQGHFPPPIGIALGLACSFMLVFSEAALRTLVDTGLRIAISPANLRNIQALASLLPTAFILMLMSVIRSEHPFIFNWSESEYLGLLEWSPFGLVARMSASANIASAVAPLAGLCVETAVIFFACTRWTNHLLRFGIVDSGSQSRVKKAPKAVVLDTGTKGRRSVFTPIQRKEIQLLMRDRTFMMQSLFMPVFICIFQVYNLSSSKFSDAFAGDFKVIAATSFGAAAYSLIFSAFQVLNAEGKALWILFTFPKRVEDIVKQKVLLWICVALIYPLALFGAGIYLSGIPSWEALFQFAIVVVGIVIYGGIAACFGVFASDPLADDPRHRTRVDYMYLYMFVASFYTYAIFAKTYWDKTSLIILSTLMALSIYQKARDHLPLMLDPTETPKAVVSLSDGLIAALAFFVLQSVAFLILVYKKSPNAQHLALAFLIGGCTTFLILRLIYWLKKTKEVPRFFGKEGLAPSLYLGLAGGAIAGLLGVLYLNFIVDHNLFAETRKAMDAPVTDKTKWIFLMAVLGAPVFEEFIFRGIIFKGLARTWSWPVAMVASAGIFAIVHPAISALPVFGLALVAAFVFHRTKILLAPMLAHATYNFIVLGYQFHLLSWDAWRTLFS